MTQRTLEVLSDEECWACLEDQTVGRVVYMGDSGPTALPVNFAVEDGEIVFRVGAGAELLKTLPATIAFEVDDLRPPGWSALARGRARELAITEVPACVRRLDKIPHPIAEGVHNVWITLAVSEVSGRRLGASKASTLV